MSCMHKNEKNNPSSRKYMKSVSLTLLQDNFKKVTPDWATAYDIQKFYVENFTWQKWHYQKIYSPNKPKVKYMSYVPDGGPKSEICMQCDTVV